MRHVTLALSLHAPDDVEGTWGGPGDMTDEIYFPAPTIGPLATAIALLPFATAVYLLIRAWHIKKKGAQS